MNTLDKIPILSSAVVKKVHAKGTSLRRRLLDMGITQGCQVTKVRQAPLGDPIELNVRGYSLIIRNEDAMLIEVEC